MPRGNNGRCNRRSRGGGTDRSVCHLHQEVATCYGRQTSFVEPSTDLARAMVECDKAFTTSTIEEEPESTEEGEAKDTVSCEKEAYDRMMDIVSFLSYDYHN